MASKKRWVVFGAGEHANKALIGFKGALRGFEVRVCQLKDKHYQLVKAIEELDELKAALRGDASLEEVAEELADAIIMTEQIRQIYDISVGELEDIINYKITRTHLRMEAEGVE